MVKKFVLAVVMISFVAIPVSSCFAANQKNTGCGLGSLIMQGNDGLAFQVLAVTTNGTFGNQTFGISSGTLNCEQPGKFVSREKTSFYIADNMDNLANDIARGHGEYLNTLAVLMEVPEGSRTDFYTLLQNNFSHIYSSPKVSSIEVLGNIESLM
ncbi:MAG: DUF3015 family protein [Desulfomonilia bacterium]|mgnify:FL=1|jgi:hypothetical protein|nr:DUF3015 domain-containing protein [Deltaproteobacteria bacterium]MDX9760876.1 DUF3015 family protein [Desulfomonilia bacterium]